jgi:Na+/pantothenate symporter
VRDIYQRGWRPTASDAEIKRLSYGCTLLIGMASMLGAANPPDFLQYLIVFAGGGLASTFLVPIALAIYWPRMNAAGMSAAMLAGLAAYLAFYLIGYLQTGTNVPYRLASLDPLMWGLAASLAAGGLVSRATRPLPARLVDFYFARGE